MLIGAVGAVSAWINVLAGGGSLLTLPVMVFMGLPGPVANGTNRVGILLQNVAACSTFFRRGYEDWRLGLSLALCALPGGILGAMLGSRLSGPWFERILAGVMFGVLILMLRKARAPAHQVLKLTPGRLAAGHIAMVGAGFWGGFIQVGVGFILMPILHRVLGLDLVRVNQHKVFIVLIYGLPALAIFAAEGQVIWQVGLSLALGNMLGGWLGAHMTLTQGEVLIRRVFAAVLLVFILVLIV